VVPLGWWVEARSLLAAKSDDSDDEGDDADDELGDTDQQRCESHLRRSPWPVAYGFNSPKTQTNLRT